MSYAPFIVAPPFTSCLPAYIVFGQGTAPYTIFPIATSSNGTSLENIPVQTKAGVFAWPKVDFDAGANITWTLTDATGFHAYSEFRVVQTGAAGAATCGKNVYSNPKSQLGAILGGVLGGLLGILTLILALFFFRRHQFKSKKQGRGETNSKPSSLLDTSEAVQAGTFNLAGLPGVQFTEPSLERLRSLDAPPHYVPGGVAKVEEEGTPAEAAAGGGGAVEHVSIPIDPDTDA